MSPNNSHCQSSASSGSSWGSVPSTPWAPSISTIPLPETNESRRSSTLTQSSTRPQDVILHPVLTYDPSGRLHYDVRSFNYAVPPHVLNHLRASGHAGDINMAAATRTPDNRPQTYCNLRIANFPPSAGTFTIRNTGGVSISDILRQLFVYLQEQISPMQYQSLPSSAHVAEAFRVRTANNAAERAFGVRRVDCLGPNVFFIGLARNANGMDCWDAYFAPALGGGRR